MLSGPQLMSTDAEASGLSMIVHTNTATQCFIGVMQCCCFFFFYSIGIRRKEHQSRINFFNEEKHAFSVLLSLLTISSFPLLSLPSNWPPPENSPENVISSLTSGFALLSSYCGRKRLMVCLRRACRTGEKCVH